MLERPEVADEVRALDQPMRAGLRRLGVRFGAYHIYIPPLLKPAPSQLLALLWAIKNGDPETPGVAELRRKYGLVVDDAIKPLIVPVAAADAGQR